MATLIAVSKERHANKRWKPYTSYAFAEADAITPMVVQELPKAALALPVAFVLQDEAFVPVAVQGLQPGQNLLVDVKGRWRAGYVPATYRGYPFALGNAEDGQKVLCLRDGGDILSETDGEPLFDAEGQPSEKVREILSFLTQVAANRIVTQHMCAALQKHGLIQPWHITLKTDAGEKTVQGLHRIDEAALNKLPADAFQELREAGALPLVYCQMLSMQNLPKLVNLLKRSSESQTTVSQTPNGELDLEFLNDSGTISFGNL